MQQRQETMRLRRYQSKSWLQKCELCVQAARVNNPSFQGTIIPVGISMWNDGLSPFSDRNYSIWFFFKRMFDLDVSISRNIGFFQGY